MKKCKPKKVVAGPTNKQPAWYKRLIPNRKTLNKWVKWLLQSVKVEISLGDMFKWIFFILVWVTLFPNSPALLVNVMKYVAPFL
jgi:hypothetical protein